MTSTTTDVLASIDGALTAGGYVDSGEVGSSMRWRPEPPEPEPEPEWYDIAQRFCGRCHDWTGDPGLAARHLARHCPHRTEGRTTTEIPDAAVSAAIAEHARLLIDRPDPMVLSDETLFRRVLEAALPHLPPAHSGRVVYAGPALVAEWLGVTRDAFGNWLRRYDDFPEPAAAVMGPSRESWCWLPGQRGDWVRWAASKDVAANPPQEGVMP